MKFGLWVCLKRWKNRGEFDQARSKKNIGENLFALASETHNRYHLCSFCGFDCYRYIRRRKWHHLYPSILQTTVASLLSQWSSHTVPRIPSHRISTRPSLLDWLPSFISCITMPEVAKIGKENYAGLCFVSRHNILVHYRLYMILCQWRWNVLINGSIFADI